MAQWVALLPLAPAAPKTYPVWLQVPHASASAPLPFAVAAPAPAQALEAAKLAAPTVPTAETTVLTVLSATVSPTGRSREEPAGLNLLASRPASRHVSGV